jgi:hypothetical protein
MVADVALAVVHVRVKLWPALMVGGVALRTHEGAGGAVT